MTVRITNSRRGNLNSAFAHSPDPMRINWQHPLARDLVFSVPILNLREWFVDRALMGRAGFVADVPGECYPTEEFGMPAARLLNAIGGGLQWDEDEWGTGHPINGASELSIFAYCRNDSQTANQQIIAAKHAGSTNGSFYLALMNQQFRFTIINSSSSRTDYDVSFPAGTDVTKPFTWAGTYDGATMRQYFEGEEVGTGSAKTGAVKDSGLVNLIIGDYSGSLWEWIGGVYCVHIWTRGLTSTDIDVLNDNPIAMYELATLQAGGNLPQASYYVAVDTTTPPSYEVAMDVEYI